MLETSLAVEYASQVVTLMATANIHDSSSGVIADLFHRAEVPGGTHPLVDMFGQTYPLVNLFHLDSKFKIH